MTLSAWRKGAALFVGAMVVAILAVPRSAAAHAVGCPELWNPHGQTTPPAGSTTLPGPNGGQNEDGFYQVIACSVAGTLVCPTGLGGPEFAAPCYCNGSTPEAVLLFDAGDGCSLPRTQWYQYSWNGDFTFDSFTLGYPLVVKYTEANGKTQDIELMAGSQQTGTPAGDSSDSVKFHIWGKGDLMVCSATDPSSCTCCKVPPPPK